MSAEIEKTTLALTSHERFCIARHQAGFPPTLCILLTYPSPSALPSSPAPARLSSIQEQYPLLRSHVTDPKTRSPHFTVQPGPFPASSLLFHETYSPSSDNTAAELYQRSLDARAAHSLTADPLWSLTTYISSTSPESHKAYLALTGHHVLFDGMGILRLCQALLAREDQRPAESLSSIKTFPETHDLRTPLKQLLPIVFRELLVPRLPTFIGSYFSGPPAWPAKADVHRPALECSGAYALLALPPSSLEALKAQAKQHGVQTLHPVLKLSLLVALWYTTRPADQNATYNVATPRNERDVSLGHATLTGCYVSSIELPLVPTPSTSFWSAAQRLASQMSSPAGIASARGRMGLLAHVPDPEPRPEDAETRTPTGWEKWLVKKAEGAVPFGTALEVTNLGWVREIPGGAEDMVWGGRASAFTPAMSAAVVGHRAGLRVALDWLDGCVLERQQVDRVGEVWKRVVGRLSGELDGEQDWTFESLAGA